MTRTNLLRRAVLVALIAAVIIATVAVLGGKINTAFNTISSKLP